MIGFFRKTRRELIIGGYITWHDNLKSLLLRKHNLIPFISLKPKQVTYSSGWLYFIEPFFRYVLKKPMTYDKQLAKLKKQIDNVSQMNPEKWNTDKKNLIR